jgi:hypothetical protein
VPAKTVAASVLSIASGPQPPEHARPLIGGERIADRLVNAIGSIEELDSRSGPVVHIKGSNKFHHTGCNHVGLSLVENRAQITSVAAAKSIGLTPCQYFKYPMPTATKPPGPKEEEKVK